MAGKKVKEYAAEVGVTGPELAKILLDMKVEGVRSAMSSLDESVWESIKPEVLEKAEPVKKKASAKKPAAKKTAKKEDEGDKSEAEAPKMKIVRKKAAAKTSKKKCHSRLDRESRKVINIPAPGLRRSGVFVFRE